MVEASDIWICTGAHLAEEVAAQVPEIPAAQILGEPVGRDTAAAVAWTLLSLPASLRGEVLVSLHSDHWIEDEDAFRHSLRTAVENCAAHDEVMALGVLPRWPETGYGYMELGEVSDPERGVYAVADFVEKPDAETAQRYVDSGNYVWNSGIFVFPIATLIAELERLTPELMAGLEALADSPAELDRIYRELPSVSIDKAVMEKLDTLSTLVLDCGWSDAGSWGSLGVLLESDADGNCTFGETLAVDARDNLLYSEGAMVAVLGVEGLAVVQTKDAVLVIPKERAQEVRRVIEELRRRGEQELL